MSILFQLIQKAHFEQMTHKEILMRCLVEMISMRFNVSSLMMIIILSQIIKCILQPEKNIKWNKAHAESCHLCIHYPGRTNMHFLCSLMVLPWQWFQYLLQLLSTGHSSTRLVMCFFRERKQFLNISRITFLLQRINNTMSEMLLGSVFWHPLYHHLYDILLCLPCLLIL